MKKFKISVIIIVIITLLLSVFFYNRINSYQRDGEIKLNGLSAPVRLIRDEKGIPYIHASNLEDAFLAQGYITAQDRLFSMEVLKLLALGRLSELAGRITREQDIQMRTIGFLRNARKLSKLIADDDQRLLQVYVNGINQYISSRENEHPIEFTLGGIRPEKWSINDVLSIIYFMSWASASSVKTKIIALMLIEKVGYEKASEIFPISSNPDDINTKKVVPRVTDVKIKSGFSGDFFNDTKLSAYMNNSYDQFALGSNNWAVSSRFSHGGKPVVANDTHQESTVLPGIMYPLSIIIPSQRAAGVTIPGIPGIQFGRSSRLAFGVTNSYHDAQDIYLETVDPANPANYLEGKKSIPFEVIRETLKIRDNKAKGGYREEMVMIQLTRRGPVISRIDPELKTKKIITMRWSPFESMGQVSLSLRDQFMAKTVREFREFLRKVSFIMLNWVFADSDGNIAWQTSGKIPVRSQQDGILPIPVKDGTDNWKGWIPFDKMPQDLNPAKGWLGTCNHKTVQDDYPFYISSHFSPYYRYARLKELMSSKDSFAPHDHWKFQRDTKNLMAKKIAPVMAEALLSYKDTESLGAILKNWDFFDNSDDAAPAIFHSVYTKLAYLVFEDELGDPLAKAMLNSWYFWQERLERMILDGKSPWFDNIFSPGQETMNDLFHKAAILSMKELGREYGSNPSKWTWGKMHRIEFINPLVREGFLKSILGGGSYPMSGSGETLYRGSYSFTRPFQVKISATLRMVADLADDEKMAAVIPGGVSARLFDRHQKDQIGPYMEGEKLFIWFSDDKISANTRSILVLNPDQK